jgi:plasmid stabilization system protein ParE
MNYIVYTSLEANADIEKLYNYIAYDLCAPMTAARYRKGITDAIDRFATTAAIYALSQNANLRRRYGVGVRTIPYKKMVIIYKVAANVVVVLRVMPGALIA